MSILFRKRRYGRPRKRYTPNFSISPEARKSIIIIVLFLFGILAILSGVGIAGVIGEYALAKISFVVGDSLVFFIAGVSFAVALFMMFPDKFSINAANYVGIGLFIVSITGLWSMSISPEEAIELAKQGEGGGVIGLITSALILPYTGTILAITINVAIFLLAIILTFNTSLTALADNVHRFVVIPIASFLTLVVRSIGSLFGMLKKESDDDDDEEIDNEEIDGDYEEEELEEKEEEEEEEEEDVDEEEEGDESFIARVTKRRTKKELPLSLLDDYTGKPTSGDIKAYQKIIKNKLASFNMEVEMIDVTVGPTITQYTLKPSKNVRLSKISALSDDLALELAAHPIRIEAPIPGKSLVGIEVPNKAVAMVKLKTLLQDNAFKKRKSNLMLALGKDVSGTNWLESLESMPHLLVAGSTGSGKSVCLSTIIVSLLYQNGPDELKFIMVDPKRVELSLFGKIPHLLTPVITDMPKVINSLRWGLKEMERRYHMLSAKGKRNLHDYNNVASPEEKLPHIVYVIDELAELMSVAASDVEAAIIRLAQMARAVGIHIVVATQRPSVDVITGLIKANMPTRIAFAVVSSADSKTILDTSGADKLIGRGDMLFMNPKISKPKRLQGVYLDDSEIGRVVDFLAEAYEQEFDETITEKHKVEGMPGMSSGGDSDDEELIIQAIEEVRRTQKASATFLQRRLSLGYARAARILDALEERGVVGPSEGAKPREVLIPEELDDMIE